MNRNPLLPSAYKYISNGICVIAVNKDKRAFLPWKKYQTELISIEEAEIQFEHTEAVSLAIVCGSVSGNLEILDIDVKYDITGSLYADFTTAIKDNDAELFDRLMIIQTVSGGYHIYYRCPVISGNLKLANRETTDEERTADPNDKIRVLIETRGQGGYVLAPPSRGYKVVQGKEIPMITPEERDMLLELARSFNQIVERPVKNHTSQGYNPKEYGLSPFEDYNKRGDVVALLTSHGWRVIRETSERVIFRRPGKTVGTSGDYLKDRQWFSVFTTSSVFEPNRAYLPYAVFAMLECRGDFKEAARRLLESGYGERREHYGAAVERDLYKKKTEGLNDEQLAAWLVNKHGKTAEAAPDIVEKLNKIWGVKICTFWDVTQNGKIVINRSRFMNFLYQTGGFSLYYYDNNSTIFKVVQQKDGLITEVSSEHVKKFIQAYVQSLPDTFDGGITSDDLMELLMKGSDIYFKKGLIEFLQRSDFDFLKDTATQAFFPFQNGIVKIKNSVITVESYADLKKVIWKSQVIDFNVSIIKDFDVTTAEYLKFLQSIAGNDQSKLEYALSIIGYVLHKYKNPTHHYAVILAEETEDETKGGGTGKGIFVKALSKLINTVRLDGKNFKADKNFAFQRVGLDTKLIFIDDVRKNLDFQAFYTIIAEGITVEKKNKDELFINYEDSPKVIISTNYTIANSTYHASRRQKVLEFSGFYRPDFTPEDHFKHQLFIDWDVDEWNRFYNLLFACVQVYFDSGVLNSITSDPNKRKQVRLNYGTEFLEWFDSYESPPVDMGWDFFHIMYANFLKENDFDKKDYSVKRFKSGLVFTTTIFGIAYKQRRNRQVNNLHQVLIAEGHKIVLNNQNGNSIVHDENLN